MPSSSDRLQEMRTRLLAALQDMSADIGPRECEHGDYSDCMECTWDETKPMEGTALLSEFVIVMNWTDMSSGESYTGIQTAPQQLLTHTNGMLHTALYEA